MDEIKVYIKKSIDVDVSDILEELDRKEAFDVIKYLDQEIISDWDFTRKLADHFIEQMREFFDEDLDADGTFKEYLLEKLV